MGIIAPFFVGFRDSFKVWSENISVGPEGDAALKPLSCRVVTWWRKNRPF